MKRRKKMISALLVFIMMLSIVGCGNSVPAVNDNVADNSTEEVGGETVDKVTATEQPDATKPPVTAEPESTVAVEPTATPEPTAAPTSTPEPTATPEPTPTPHVHQWSETVTKEAGCSTEGEKKLTCECGETKTEVIPATGNHNWVEGTTVIHHEELGHVEQVQTGTTAGYTTYACAVCGAEFDTPSGVVDHCAAFVPDLHGMANTIAYDHPGEPIYENQWKIDQPAWDETVGTGTYTCSVCGATK